MNRKILLFCALTLPVFILINIVQSYNFEQHRREVSALEKEQKVWMEKNKRMLAGIAILSSPARLEKLAREMGLRPPAQDKVIKVQLAKRNADG